MKYSLHVRGTVLDIDKSKWLAELFDQKYGPGKFGLLEVKDSDTSEALGDAIKGRILFKLLIDACLVSSKRLRGLRVDCHECSFLAGSEHRHQ